MGREREGNLSLHLRSFFSQKALRGCTLCVSHRVIGHGDRTRRREKSWIKQSQSGCWTRVKTKNLTGASSGMLSSWNSLLRALGSYGRD